MIDTHCHLYSEEFKNDIQEVIISAKKAGISQIFMPNIDSESIDSMLDIENTHLFCHSMMGLHPCHVKENFKEELKIVDNWFSKREFFGVGETGIDLYWDKTYVQEQMTSFEYQIDIAKNSHLPVIIHSRESLDLTIEIIQKKQDGSLKGVFHCFNGSNLQARKIKDVGFCIGLGGVITYKNANMSDVILENGLSNVVLETDAPYLSPGPHRGKRNEPAFIKHVVDKLAEITSNSKHEIEIMTNENANKLFSVHTKTD